MITEEKSCVVSEERPVYALEDMLAMFLGIITPPLIIAAIVGLDTAETGFSSAWH